jgi:hypothetical protein
MRDVLTTKKGLQVKVQGQHEEMLLAACEQFLGKTEQEIHTIALETLEGHQRAIMGSMSVEVSQKNILCEIKETEVVIMNSLSGFQKAMLNFMDT